MPDPLPIAKNAGTELCLLDTGKVITELAVGEALVSSSTRRDDRNRSSAPTSCRLPAESALQRPKSASG
jgi:hypothetical protein